jgi:hypothetical protein
MEKYTLYTFKIPPRGLYGVSCIHKSDGKPLTLYQLTPCSGVFLGKLILGHLVRKNPLLWYPHVQCDQHRVHSHQNRNNWIARNQTYPVDNTLRGETNVTCPGVGHSYAMRAEGIFPCRLSGVGVKLTIHMHLMPRLRIHGALQSLPCVSSWHVALCGAGTTSARQYVSRNIHILMCSQSGGRMLYRVTTYKHYRRRNLMTLLQQNRPWVLKVKSSQLKGGREGEG